MSSIERCTKTWRWSLTLRCTTHIDRFQCHKFPFHRFIQIFTVLKTTCPAHRTTSLWRDTTTFDQRPKSWRRCTTKKTKTKIPATPAKWVIQKMTRTSVCSKWRLSRLKTSTMARVEMTQFRYSRYPHRTSVKTRKPALRQVTLAMVRTTKRNPARVITKKTPMTRKRRLQLDASTQHDRQIERCDRAIRREQLAERSFIEE